MYPTGLRNWLIIMALFLAELTAAFETSMIYAAMPTLLKTFGSPATVGWLVTIYLLVGAGVSAVAGRLGDIYGRRRLVIIIMFLAALGSLLSAVSSQFGLVLVGRALQGLALSVLPLSFGLVRENMPEKQVPVAVGLMISAASAGTAVGLVLGGYIVDNFSWHWIFVVSGVLAIISVVAVWLAVPPSKGIPTQHGMDWLGGVLFVPAIASMLLALSKGAEWGWSDPVILALGFGGLGLFLVWVRQSLRHPEPFIDIRLLKNRDVLIANLVSVVIALGALQLTLVFSMLLQAPAWTGIGLGVSAMVSGLVKLPSNILSVFAGPLSGWLAARNGARIVMLVGGGLVAAGWTAAGFIPGSVFLVGVILCVISFGTTILYANVPNVIVAAVPANRTSEATGMMSVIRSASMAIGAQLISVILASNTVQGPDGSGSYPTPWAFQLTIATIVGLTLAGMLLALMLPKERLGATAVAAH